jgi:hypothetical protein
MTGFPVSGLDRLKLVSWRTGALNDSKAPLSPYLGFDVRATELEMGAGSMAAVGDPEETGLLMRDHEDRSELLARFHRLRHALGLLFETKLRVRS